LVTSAVQRSSKTTGTVWEAVRQQQAVVIGAGLFILAVVSRLPFQEKILYHWDSINFALSLQRFDVAAGQPHIPGYILYVLLARLVNAVTDDAQLTLVGISLVSSGLAVAFLYVLGSTMFNRATGLTAALFLASSPLFWFYGEVALPHSLDALVVIVTVWLLYRIMQGEMALAVPAAIWIAIAGGLRPQTQLFLMPLALVAGWRLGWKRGLLALSVMAVVDFAWAIPLVWSTGGLARYLQVTREFTAAFNTTTSVFSGGGLWGLQRNVHKLAMYTLYGWGLAVIPAVAGGLKVLRSSLTRRLATEVAPVGPARVSGPGGAGAGRQASVEHPPAEMLAPTAQAVGRHASALSGAVSTAVMQDVRFWVMLLWLAPVLVFYVFIHMGQQGLVFVFLPALLLLSAAMLYQVWTRPPYQRLLIAALVMVNAAIFVAAPTYPLGGNQVKLLTVDTLRRQDADYAARLDAVSRNFSSRNTALLSSGWRYPQYYLPGYALVSYALVSRWELGEGSPVSQTEKWLDGAALGLTPDANGFFTLVLFDNDLDPFNQSPERQELMRLSNGQELAYLRFAPSERVYIGPTSFEIVPAAQAH
jgi:4-amino-4-deoxy-L-arabinose transferase-like glycosyltransferase